jgi:GWxTD domain-containing protein
MNYKNAIFRVVMIAGVAVFTSLQGYAQIDAYNETMENPLEVYIDAMSFSTGDTANGRLDVYVQVGYDQLTFIRSKQSYTAECEITIDVLDEQDQLVVEKTWTDRAATDTFEVSVSPQYFMMSERSVTLLPGIYTLKINYLDLESKRGIKETRKIRIPDYAHQKTELSDIMIISKMTKEGEKRIVTPNISGNVSNLEGGFYLFFEYYPAANHDSVEFQYSLINAKRETIYTRSNIEPAEKRGMQVFIKIDSIDVPAGEYTLNLESHPRLKEKAPAFVSLSQRQITLHWKGIPLSVSDLDEAIKQLRYISRESELDSLLEAPTLSEKQTRFKEFWKKRDPSPDTPKNELMEEYYRRVAFTNKRFTRYRPGWKTDMGMIFIIFGPPNTVDRHPFEMDSKPYEIWTYFDIRQSILFVDETGFGDYRLQNLDWELQRRLPH